MGAAAAPGVEREQILCGHRGCYGIVLKRTSSGRGWLYRHEKRRLVFEGRIYVEVDCPRGHTVRLEIDGSRVRRLD